MAKAQSNDKHVERALANGAEIIGDAPAPARPATTKRAADGQHLYQLDHAAQRGWRGIETPDGVRYRWRDQRWHATHYMDYDTAAAYGAATSPEDADYE